MNSPLIVVSRGLSACAVGLLAVVSGWLHAAEAPETFVSYCAACHGERGEGGNMGGPSLVLDRTRQLTDDELVVTVSAGRQEHGMPAFEASLSRGEILSLVGYIRQLQGVAGDPVGANQVTTIAPPEPGPSAEIVRGKRLFFGKAGCAECHAVLLEGGRTGPNLTKIEKRRSREQIHTAITVPSASIKKGYEVMEIITRDGETIRGWARTERTPEGSVQLYYPPESLWTTYFKTDLKSWRVVSESMMPAGLLDDLTEQEVEDLMAYLLSPKRVTLK